jgi:hypothetical protein
VAIRPTVQNRYGARDYRGHTLIPGAGHWVQQEKPDESNDALLGFLTGLEPTPATASAPSPGRARAVRSRGDPVALRGEAR